MAGPLYRQIAEDLRHKIESDELAPGGRLPTEDELMLTYRASRNTVRGAINQLTIRGLVNTLHGKGTFVAEQINPIVTTLTTDPEIGGVAARAWSTPQKWRPAGGSPRLEVFE